MFPGMLFEAGKNIGLTRLKLFAKNHKASISDCSVPLSGAAFVDNSNESKGVWTLMHFYACRLWGSRCWVNGWSVPRRRPSVSIQKGG